ncbi:MAG: FG-GAP-like repeat-containing protein [Deltaproteobacteria bacterium]|nr:FG-GAP-like repeat-containing protein [Deltaproteobacteria bacterium]
MAAVLLLMAFVEPLWAKDKNTVVVLPFSVHSGENIDYVRQGIGDMLASRISVNDRIDVVGKDSVLAALQDSAAREIGAADALAIAKRVSADFVVWGSITKIGSSLSIDAKLVEVATNKNAVSMFAQCPTMDEVIPKINEFAQRIDTHILGGVPETATAAPPAPKEIIVSRKPTPQNTREAEIISGMRASRRGTYTSSINPDFINAAQPLDKKTFWKSQQFPSEFRGMDIGDVNGDGINETVMIDTNNILIYQKKGNEFTLFQKIDGKSYDNYISLDVADINGNGIKEIIVSSYTGQMMDSFIIEFRAGKFVTIASGLPWFLRVIDTGGAAGPILLSQRKGLDQLFDPPIYQIVYLNGEYREGQKMRIPQGLSVYGLTMDKLGSGGAEKIITLNEYDYICIYEQTDRPLSEIAVVGGSEEFIWKSEDVFGGSNTTVETAKGSTVNADDPYNYINLRILTYDTNKDGKKEVIIVKNIAATGRLFQRVKLFTSAEVYDLEWDGMGMVENWRTKKIAGYVADYQFKDIDNDGDNEVVLALVLSVGGSLRGRSVVVAYKLAGE